MKAYKIRFRGYEWEHNPAQLKVSGALNLREHIICGGKSAVQNLGSRARTVNGKGSFVGENALEKYSELVRLSETPGSGVLCIPGVKPFYAYLRKVELDCDSTPDAVNYSFEFTEDASARQASQPVYHTLAENEDLWDVSYRFAVSIEKLVSLNPGIRFINEPEEGARVRVC